MSEPRGPLPPDVEKATRRIHRAVWRGSYRAGDGPMHYATGPYWPNELLRLADSWERMAVAARICSAHMAETPEGIIGPDDTHDWRDDDIVLGTSMDRFCVSARATRTSSTATDRPATSSPLPWPH